LVQQTKRRQNGDGTLERWAIKTGRQPKRGEEGGKKRPPECPGGGGGKPLLDGLKKNRNHRGATRTTLNILKRGVEKHNLSIMSVICGKGGVKEQKKNLHSKKEQNWRKTSVYIFALKNLLGGGKSQ